MSYDLVKEFQSVGKNKIMAHIFSCKLHFCLSLTVKKKKKVWSQLEHRLINPMLNIYIKYMKYIGLIIKNACNFFKRHLDFKPHSDLHSAKCIVKV